MNAIKDLTLVSTVELMNRGDSTYHFVYASQLYQTLFAVYAKFIGDPIILPDKRKVFSISGITLKLINYKGNINIGFTSHDADWEPDTSTLTFGVRGISTTVDKDIEFEDHIIVEDGKRFPIIFSRVLFPLPDFEGYLEDRNGSSVNGSQIKSEPPISQLFDTEFNDRDGIDFYNRELKPGMFDPSHGIVGNRCNFSDINLLYHAQ